MGDSIEQIQLRGLRLVGIVGVLPEERTRAQPLEVDLDLHADLGAAGASDALVDTIDYGAVCDVVADVVATARPQLLERLGELIAVSVLDVDDRVQRVTVSVRKLRPPVAHALASSGVRLVRSR